MNFKFKRILAVVMIAVFAFSGACFAKAKAGGGGFKAAPPAASSKSLAPSQKTETAAPKSNAADANKSNANNAAGSSANNSAASSSAANKTNQTAQTNQTNQAASAAQQSGSRWGSALRSIGLFAGGMFLGSMLGNMFGMGGMFADILGLLFNVVLIAVVVMIIMAVFRRFFGKKNEGSAYASSRYAESNCRCERCGWVSPDRNNPPKFCPECGNRMNGQSCGAGGYNESESAESSNRIIDITPPKDKDKY